MRGFSTETADPSISQMPRHYWISAICDAVVLIYMVINIAIIGNNIIAIRPHIAQRNVQRSVGYAVIILLIILSISTISALVRLSRFTTSIITSSRVATLLFLP